MLTNNSVGGSYAHQLFTNSLTSGTRSNFALPNRHVMASRKSAKANDFVLNPNAPISFALRKSLSSLLVEYKITGISLMELLDLSFSQNSNPVILGILMSTKTKSGFGLED